MTTKSVELLGWEESMEICIAFILPVKDKPPEVADKMFHSPLGKAVTLIGFFILHRYHALIHLLQRDYLFCCAQA